ncbi:MAG: hypothetical protein ACYDHW_14435 [Syntrophorhabdaceae bacterium]
MKLHPASCNLYELLEHAIRQFDGIRGTRSITIDSPNLQALLSTMLTLRLLIVFSVTMMLSYIIRVQDTV